LQAFNVSLTVAAFAEPTSAAAKTTVAAAKAQRVLGIEASIAGVTQLDSFNLSFCARGSGERESARRPSHLAAKLPLVMRICIDTSHHSNVVRVWRRICVTTHVQAFVRYQLKPYLDRVLYLIAFDAVVEAPSAVLGGADAVNHKRRKHDEDWQQSLHGFLQWLSERHVK
jgi:hypothetical protein